MNKKEVILVVVGTKSFKDYKFFEEKMYGVLTPYFLQKYQITIREKEENTTDNFVVRFCKENNLNLERVPILWNDYGRSAAYQINKALLYGKDPSEGRASKFMVVFINKKDTKDKLIGDLWESFNSCVTYENNPILPKSYIFMK